MPLFDRGRHALHYESIGDAAKPPVLLIMGLALSSRAWDRLPDLLARDFRVLVFDNVGTGKSARRGAIWPTTPRRCSTMPASRLRTSSASRWAG